jgi:hypothetical protein
MLYSYDGTNPGDLNVDEGREVIILEPDGTHFSLLPLPSTY